MEFKMRFPSTFKIWKKASTNFKVTLISVALAALSLLFTLISGLLNYLTPILFYRAHIQTQSQNLMKIGKSTDTVEILICINNRGKGDGFIKSMKLDLIDFATGKLASSLTSNDYGQNGNNSPFLLLHLSGGQIFNGNFQFTNAKPLPLHLVPNKKYEINIKYDIVDDAAFFQKETTLIDTAYFIPSLSEISILGKTNCSISLTNR